MPSDRAWNERHTRLDFFRLFSFALSLRTSWTELRRFGDHPVPSVYPKNFFGFVFHGAYTGQEGSRN